MNIFFSDIVFMVAVVAIIACWFLYIYKGPFWQPIVVLLLIMAILIAVAFVDKATNPVLYEGLVGGASAIIVVAFGYFCISIFRFIASKIKFLRKTS